MHGLDPCIQGRHPQTIKDARRLDARLEAGMKGPNGSLLPRTLALYRDV